MQDRWIVLSEQIRAEGKYFSARTTARKLSKRFYAGRAVVRQIDSPVASLRFVQGYAALWRTAVDGWYELGTVWVTPELRGNGVQFDLMTELVAKAPQGKGLFLITDAFPVMRTAGILGFRPVTLATMPDVHDWSAVVDLGERLPRTALLEALPMPKDGERWLFIRRS